MRVKFWGVRGSIPTPEHRNARYGGNTTCVEIRLDNGSLIVLDCGSGFRALGKRLARDFNDRPIQGHVFLTHFHWDHIQGIPFFQPLYCEKNIFAFHAVERTEKDLQAAIEGQMSGPYFPVDASVMAAKRGFFDLGYGTIHINGAMITSAPLNHPQGCAGYRIEADGSVIVLATDTEHGSPLHDRSVRDLALGADVFAYDAQYTPQEMNGKRGWGHSTWLEGTRIAKECGVSQLVLFHHDPDHDDAFVDAIVQKAQEEFPNVLGAAEGMEFSLPRREVVRSYAPSIPRHERRYRVEVPVHVAWTDERGRQVEAEAVAHDVSRTGIYFLAPADVQSEGPVELQMVLPDEVTQQGPMKVCFSAQTIRREKVTAPLNGNPRCVGVAARRLPSRSNGHANKHLNYIA